MISKHKVKYDNYTVVGVLIISTTERWVTYMTLVEKIKQKQADIYSARPITLAFLGDSVTQGCFELYPEEPGNLNVVYDSDAVYHNQIKKIFSILYPSMPVNIINAGISGDDALRGLERLDRDVLSYKPDLTVVCFGLNDSCYGTDKLQEYVDSLHGIFTKSREADSAVIFLTPNMIGTRVNQRINDSKIRKTAECICTAEKNGFMDLFMNSARALCEEMEVPVCDCYSLWKGMQSAGVDTTGLLSNDINHPIREMHKMFAYELVKIMLGGKI